MWKLDCSLLRSLRLVIFLVEILESGTDLSGPGEGDLRCERGTAAGDAWAAGCGVWGAPQWTVGDDEEWPKETEVGRGTACEKQSRDNRIREGTLGRNEWDGQGTLACVTVHHAAYQPSTPKFPTWTRVSARVPALPLREER